MFDENIKQNNRSFELDYELDEAYTTGLVIEEIQNCKGVKTVGFFKCKKHDAELTQGAFENIFENYFYDDVENSRSERYERFLIELDSFIKVQFTAKQLIEDALICYACKIKEQE